MKSINPIALYRATVLGPLVSCTQLDRGELARIIQEASEREYNIPGSDRTRIGKKTIESWYYKYLKDNLEGLTPKLRKDKGQSQIRPELQEAIIATKKANPKRSIRIIRDLLIESGRATDKELSRSAIHRLLVQHDLSQRTSSMDPVEEKRSFVAKFANDIWYADVMHGPHFQIDGCLRKVYLVSQMDDASRLAVHSEFRLGETALDIESSLKQAFLKRGLPIKYVVDNGAAYRSSTLKAVCARFGAHLILCRPYHPESKGKLERWHRTIREQFLSEIHASQINSLTDLNTRLWAWLETRYHHTPHSGLDGATPLERYQQDLARIRPLGMLANKIDELFYHRVHRYVRRDGTVSYLNTRFEVQYELAGKTVILVVDPHAKKVIGVENDQGVLISEATPLDLNANLNRKRQKTGNDTVKTTEEIDYGGLNPVESAHSRYYGIKEE